LKSWADHILGIHVDFENQCNDNKNKINSGLSVAREKCDHFSQEASATLDLQLRRRTEQLTACEAQTEELLDSVSNSRETVRITCAVIPQLPPFLSFAADSHCHDIIQCTEICSLVDAEYGSSRDNLLYNMQHNYLHKTAGMCNIFHNKFSKHTHNKNVLNNNEFHSQVQFLALSVVAHGLNGWWN
jgi:hypothetical protein